MCKPLKESGTRTCLSSGKTHYKLLPIVNEDLLPITEGLIFNQTNIRKRLSANYKANETRFGKARACPLLLN